MSTVAEARELLDRALAYGLEGARRLADDYPLDVLAARWNGIGPERMDQDARKRLTKWLKLYIPACFIHDQDFAESDGTRGGFIAANDRLDRNCRIIADDTYPKWYDFIRRHFARRGARLVANACRLAGWDAWRDAFAARSAANPTNPPKGEPT